MPSYVETTDDDLVALVQHPVDEHHINRGAQTLHDFHLQHGALQDKPQKAHP